ncbi:hypothetical protein CYMTET_32876 [Cymbomonas tetramitiformis]|uniref:Rab-GAP TBC domain-containing protein n=1 Tax=Cymbomonas tetramitiformis TaxID=36881 RepID=A0AAE0KRH5_9CHLO|nr:hypothetical protein CYMTET_32876 [Cymbomonas tetramitiformis]
MRSLVWKLLLEYLPCDRKKWKSTLAAKRNDYEQFCEELIINPSKVMASEADSHASTQDGSLVGTDVTATDHPLSVQDNSVWKSYFKDTDLLEQIDRDVMRTHPDLQFFSGEGDATKKHQDDMRRALLLFAKLNPGLRYVQGMNELYAPLYYTFSLDPDPAMAEHAEADAFFCFVELISDLRDNFCQQLDNSGVGIKATIGKLNTMLSENDRELWVHLEQNTKVNPQFYAFRWITLLFTQEFDLPDLMRVWDSLLSSPNGRLGYVLTMCCGMLMTVRDELLTDTGEEEVPADDEEEPEEEEEEPEEEEDSQQEEQDDPPTAERQARYEEHRREPAEAALRCKPLKGAVGVLIPGKS